MTETTVVKVILKSGESGFRVTMAGITQDTAPTIRGVLCGERLQKAYPHIDTKFLNRDTLLIGEGRCTTWATVTEADILAIAEDPTDLIIKIGAGTYPNEFILLTSRPLTEQEERVLRNLNIYVGQRVAARNGASHHYVLATLVGGCALDPRETAKALNATLDA